MPIDYENGYTALDLPDDLLLEDFDPTDRPDFIPDWMNEEPEKKPCP